ncbi:MAG: hypothetical protein GY708_12025 [Actinomycetia bacterium]|nr:hypothetical protein [Actinomycetes bacterium]MCP4961594.1 hypothetical protein [Actinomycetes bacterium]
MAPTTMKISTETRDRLRELVPDGTLEDAVVEACDALEDRRFWADCDDWTTWRDGLPADQRTAIADRDARLERLVRSSNDLSG